MGWVRGEFLSRISLFGVSVLVLRMNVGNGSVSACALASCGGDVEERLGLPQLGPPLQVIYVGCGGFCIWTCSEMGGKNKAQQTKKVIEEHLLDDNGSASGFTCLLAAVGSPDFGERRDPSVLGAEHGGLWLAVIVEMGVWCAVQRTEPLSCGCLCLRQLRMRGGRNYET